MTRIRITTYLQRLTLQQRARFTFFSIMHYEPHGAVGKVTDCNRLISTVHKSIFGLTYNSTYVEIVKCRADRTARSKPQSCSPRCSSSLGAGITAMSFLSAPD